MRLTTKIVNNYIVPDNVENIIVKSLNKLGQLEDIEEELGIDLITLFKALRQFFAKDLDCYCPRPISLFQDVRNEWYISWIGHYYKLKDYGKTWALTKEELL